MSESAIGCCVCGEPADETNASDCYGCGRLYHLNQRNDVVARDCGDVWLNDSTLALEFGCQTCIDERFGEPDATTTPSADGSESADSGRESRRRRYRRIG